MGFGLYKNEIQGEKNVGFGTNSEQSKWFEKNGQESFLRLLRITQITLVLNMNFAHFVLY